MAISRHETLLSLDRLAETLGFAPPHFNGAATGDAFPISSQCDDVLPQRAWQRNDAVSRDEIGEKVATAEQDIAKAIGYWPAPKWIVGEKHLYPKNYHFGSSGGLSGKTFCLGDGVSGTGLGSDGLFKGTKTNWKKLIAPGQRLSTLLGTPTVAAGGIVFSDADGDGYNETTTITLAVATEPDAEDVHLYYVGKSGDPVFEIKSLRSVDWTAGTLTIVVWTWQVIALSKLDAFPTADSFRAIDTTDTANLVASLDIYTVENDQTETSAEFFWEGTVETQTGVFIPTGDGYGKLVPATYSSDNGYWTSSNWLVGREPDRVKIWYYAGVCDVRFPAMSLDPLSDYWAETIVWLSIARITRHLCACDKLRKFADELQLDASVITPDSRRHNIPFNYYGNPFGTRMGELMAWRRVEQYIKTVGKVALI